MPKASGAVTSWMLYGVIPSFLVEGWAGCSEMKWPVAVRLEVWVTVSPGSCSSPTWMWVDCELGWLTGTDVAVESMIGIDDVYVSLDGCSVECWGLRRAG